MRAGLARSVVAVHRDTAVDPTDANSVGEVVPVWTELCARPMQINPADGQEAHRDGTTIASQRTEFRARYDRVLASVTEKDRLVFGGETYDIASVVNVGQRNKELRFIGVRRDG